VKLTQAAIVTWCAWTAANALGMFLAFRLFFGLVEGVALPVPRGFWTDTVNAAVVGAGAGALLGLCQALALVLLRHLRAGDVLAWTAATASGVGLALGVARGGDGVLRLVGAGALFDAVAYPTWRLVAVLMLGGAIGLAQWLVLRRLAPRAGWWVPACAAATAATFYSAYLPQPLMEVVGGLAFRGLFGAATGVVLAWVLRTRHDATGSLGAGRPTASTG
jgi:hypothetical protein